MDLGKNTELNTLSIAFVAQDPPQGKARIIYRWNELAQWFATICASLNTHSLDIVLRARPPRSRVVTVVEDAILGAKMAGRVTTLRVFFRPPVSIESEDALNTHLMRCFPRMYQEGILILD